MTHLTNTWTPNEESNPKRPDRCQTLREVKTIK